MRPEDRLICGYLRNWLTTASCYPLRVRLVGGRLIRLLDEASARETNTGRQDRQDDRRDRL
jgi:hypothetical protein